MLSFTFHIWSVILVIVIPIKNVKKQNKQKKKQLVVIWPLWVACLKLALKWKLQKSFLPHWGMDWMVVACYWWISVRSENVFALLLLSVTLVLLFHRTKICCCCNVSYSNDIFECHYLSGAGVLLVTNTELLLVYTLACCMFIFCSSLSLVRQLRFIFHEELFCFASALIKRHPLLQLRVGAFWGRSKERRGVFVWVDFKYQ